MAYDPNSARKGGSRKHLVETVIKVVEAHKHGKNSVACMDEILLAVRRHQKDSGGKK
jgi:hypothetical protein